MSTVESDLSRIAPTTLPLSPSVMDNVLEILQMFRKTIQETTLNNCFSSLQLTQIRLWLGCDLFFLLITVEFQLLKNSYKGKVSVARQISV